MVFTTYLQFKESLEKGLNLDFPVLMSPMDCCNRWGPLKWSILLVTHHSCTYTVKCKLVRRVCQISTKSCKMWLPFCVTLTGMSFVNFQTAWTKFCNLVWHTLENVPTRNSESWNRKSLKHVGFKCLWKTNFQTSDVGVHLNIRWRKRSFKMCLVLFKSSSTFLT